MAAARQCVLHGGIELGDRRTDRIGPLRKRRRRRTRCRIGRLRQDTIAYANEKGWDNDTQQSQYA